MCAIEIHPGTRAALYARVSSDQQAQAQTIASQVEALQERLRQDRMELDPELSFIDDDYSGATLVRPALERLRDMAALGVIERLYVHSPDRLARKYAYQVLLLEELRRGGVEVVFLNHAVSDNPEEQLLLQVQGMMAEYERAKIIERHRRGKLHAARHGSVNVLSGAPYGYRYVSARATEGHAAYEIVLEQARVVRQIFTWVGQDRLSLREVCRRLQNQGIRTATGKSWWDPTTVWGLLQNPAYQGQAAYGKTRYGPLRPRLRPPRGHPAQPRRAHSIYDVPADEQIPIAVPALVEPDLFAAVQEQLQENRRQQRERRRGARYLLQGLLVCGTCGHAYYGKPVSLKAGKGKKRSYAYYRCIGSDAYRFGGQRLCWNKQVRTDLLEQVVWQDVCSLLQEPQRIAREQERRLTKNCDDSSLEQLRTLTQKVKRGMGRLIDAYQDGLIDRAQFEPRLHQAQDRLQSLNDQITALTAEQNRLQDLQLVVTQVETFAKMLEGSLAKADWSTKRQVIRTLVKQIEIGGEAVKVVYRIDSLPFVQAPERGILPYCWRGEHPTLRRPLPRSMVLRRVVRPFACFHHYRRQPHPDQVQDTAVRHPFWDTRPQLVVGNRIEVTAQIRVIHFLSALLQVPPNLGQGLVGITARSKPIRALQEIRLKDRLQEQQHRHLHHPVLHRRDAQRSLFAVGLGNVHTLHRLGSIGLVLKRSLDRLQKALDPTVRLFHRLDAHAVNAGRAMIRSYPSPRGRQHVPAVHAVVQSIEPKLRLLFRLTV
jgi:site-specific DNA recombinase